MPDHNLSDFSLPPGTMIEGRYRIVDRIGQGGFAMVYKAEHSSLGKEVALKVLDLTGNAHDVNMFRTRFQREAQLASKLEHPNDVAYKAVVEPIPFPCCLWRNLYHFRVACCCLPLPQGVVSLGHGGALLSANR